ncbi:MAG: AAA family ATPase [Myxococcales bacterium]|nr:AAA family ATPase [Myxococcales bacterium]
MVALHRIAVENFLSLRSVDVTLGQLSVLVGPNGAGKSNLLDAIRFLGDTARFDLQPTLDRRGGFAEVLFKGRGGGKRIKFTIEAVATAHAHDNARDEYTLEVSRYNVPSGPVLRRTEEFKFKRIQGPGRRITVKGARFDLDDGRGAPRSRSVRAQTAGLATLQKLGDDAGGAQVRELASLFETFRVFDIDSAAARRPSVLEPRPSLASDASNLASFLLWLSMEHPEVYQLLEADLAYVLPGFERLELRPVGGSAESRVIHLKEAGIAEPIPLARASFGTVRALALFAMLHDPEPPKLTCVEEIDHGLHPYALDRIVERLRSASRRTQLLIATHSPALVNRLRPEELIVCERDVASGASRIPAIDAALVRQMTQQSDLTLGELWFSGALGGAL